MTTRTLVDVLIEQKKKNQKYFVEYRNYALEIKQIVKRWLEDARLLVFGSVVKGSWLPNKSDIDILIISKRVSKSATWQSDLKVQVLQELGDITAPFEFHFATPETYSGWYQKFIQDDYVEV